MFLPKESIETDNFKPLYLNRNFMLIMSARFIAFLGNSIHYFALSWYIINVIGEGKILGLLLTLSSLPSVLLGPFVGVLADRFDRRKIMVLMNAVRCVLATALGYMVYTDNAPLWIFFAVTLLLSICGAVYFPASGALFPSLVHEKQLIRANSIASFINTFTSILGPTVAGVLYKFIGPGGLFMLDGAGFLFAAVCELLLIVPYVKYNAAFNTKIYLSNLREGLKFVFNTKALFAVLIFGGVVNFFFWPVQNIVQPIIGSKVAGFDSAQYGIVSSFFSWGMLAATVLVSILPQPKRKYRFMIWSMLAQSIGLIMLALPILPPVFPYIADIKVLFYIYSIIIFFRGLAFGFTNVPMQVVYQTLTPDDYRGRVFALQGAFFQGLMPVAMGIAGFVVEALPAYAICLFAGVFMGLACLYMFRVKATQDI